jgi:hypothetical protein
MLALLIAAVSSLALAATFCCGVMVGLARRPVQPARLAQPASACRYPGPPVEPGQLSHPRVLGSGAAPAPARSRTPAGPPGRLSRTHRGARAVP